MSKKILFLFLLFLITANKILQHYNSFWIKFDKAWQENNMKFYDCLIYNPFPLFRLNLLFLHPKLCRNKKFTLCFCVPFVYLSTPMVYFARFYSVSGIFLCLSLFPHPVSLSFSHSLSNFSVLQQISIFFAYRISAYTTNEINTWFSAVVGGNTS